MNMSFCLKAGSMQPLRSISKLSACSLRQIARMHTIPEESISSSDKQNLYGFGFSATGSLGMKQNVKVKKRDHRGRFNVSLPKRLTCFSEKISTIACGYGFTGFISKGGRVYFTGLNSDGQLGLQKDGIRAEMHDGQLIEVVSEPHSLDLSSFGRQFKPKLLACGRAHTLIYLVDKHSDDFCLLSLGNNVFGQGGRKTVEGEVFSSDHAVISRVNLDPSIKSIRKIVCGQDHSLLLTDDGRVFSAGLGSDGQTGLGHYKSVDRFMQVTQGGLADLSVIDLASKGDTCLALTKCRRLFCWGNNEYGQIWTKSDTMQLASPQELDISSETVIVPPEAGFTNQADLQLGKIKSIAAAGSMLGFLDSHGQVFVWGFGVLGLGPLVEFTPRPTLIPPGLFQPALPYKMGQLSNLTSGLHHFSAWSDKLGLMWTWGCTRSGISALGLGNEDKEQTYPRKVIIPGKISQVVCGVDHTFVDAQDL